MRLAFAIASLLHAFAHLPGFVGSWHLGAGVPHKTTIIADRVDVGDVGIRALGILWLLAGAAFLLVAAAAITRVPWWPQLALGVVAFSLALCLVHLPDARFGAAVNVALLVVLALR
jgi:hypothetical protein